jgi:flagellar hook-basal body complex protein FliE
MTPEAISALSSVAQDPATAADLVELQPATTTQGPSFATWMSTEVDKVNTQMVSAEHGLQQLAAGGQVSLHEVMMRAEEARLSFQLMVQMRNKVLEAYQDIMRMQA